MIEVDGDRHEIVKGFCYSSAGGKTPLFVMGDYHLNVGLDVGYGGSFVLNKRIYIGMAHVKLISFRSTYDFTVLDGVEVLSSGDTVVELMPDEQYTFICNCVHEFGIPKTMRFGNP